MELLGELCFLLNELGDSFGTNDKSGGEKIVKRFFTHVAVLYSVLRTCSVKELRLLRAVFASLMCRVKNVRNVIKYC